MSDPQAVKWEISRFPLYLHIMGAVCCLGFSATFHHFKDMSRETSEKLSRLDYAGISMLIAGSNMPPIYYSFYCQPYHFWRNFYMIGQWFLCTLVFASSFWSKFDQPRFRPLRGSLFVTLGVAGVIPIVHIVSFIEAEYLPKFDYLLWAIGGVTYIVGAIIYMARVPERWFPNRFDFFGSSHQIFHLFILAAAWMHFYASLQCFHTREHSPCPNELLDLF
jgi:adiponectin receptor